MTTELECREIGGLVLLVKRGDGSGWRVVCPDCAMVSRTGTYVWDAEHRAARHIAEEHERRGGVEDRRRGRGRRNGDDL